MNTTLPLHSPAAIVQQSAEVAWEQMVQEIGEYERQSSQIDWEFGDYLAEQKTRWGSEKQIKKAVEEAGACWETARGRMWVSSRVPAGSKLRNPDLYPISYSHFKTIAGTENVEEWADRIVEAGVPAVSVVKGWLGEAKLQQAATDKKLCIQCEQELPEGGLDIGMIRLSGRSLAHICSLQCGRDWFNDLLHDDKRVPEDPFPEDEDAGNDY